MDTEKQPTSRPVTDFSRSFSGLLPWFKRNSIFLLGLEIIPVLCFIGLFQNARVENSGTTKIYIQTPVGAKFTYFLESAKDAELQKDASFWQQEGSEKNPFLSIRLLALTGELKEDKDSCFFGIGFTQEKPEPDSTSLKKLKNLLELKLSRDTAIAAQLKWHFDKHRKFEEQLKSLEILRQTGVASKDSLSLFHFRKLDNFLRESSKHHYSQSQLKLHLLRFQKSSSKQWKSAMLAAGLAQAVIALFFFVRFLLTGK